MCPRLSKCMHLDLAWTDQVVDIAVVVDHRMMMGARSSQRLALEVQRMQVQEVGEELWARTVGMLVEEGEGPVVLTAAEVLESENSQMHYGRLEQR